MGGDETVDQGVDTHSGLGRRMASRSVASGYVARLRGCTNNSTHINEWFSPALKGSILRMLLERDAVDRLVMYTSEYIR